MTETSTALRDSRADTQDQTSVVELMEQSFTDPYEIKYVRLQKKCESIKMQNYRLINHIYQVNKLVRKAKKQNINILGKLDEYNPDIRNQFNTTKLMESLRASSALLNDQNPLKHRIESLCEQASASGDNHHSNEITANNHKRMKYDSSSTNANYFHTNANDTCEPMETTNMMDTL